MDQRVLPERPDGEDRDPLALVDTATHDPEAGLTQPQSNSDVSYQRPTKCKDCVICTEAIEEGATYPCKGCKRPYCVSCLKSMFLTACKDESRMPPRCCHMLQLSIVLPHLSQQEADLYRAGYEEWSTPNRVYCPVPSCSAFIPSRLIATTTLPVSPRSRHIDLEKVGRGPEDDRRTVTFGTGVKMEIHTPPPTPPSTSGTPRSPSPPTVSCPRCVAQVCVSCKQLTHPGVPCTSNDLDPELAVLLTKWKIKRCPKCRAAVKRMFGCSHIRCRCGAQWCWYCQEPIAMCLDDGCTMQDVVENSDEGEDNDDEEDEVEGQAVEDLDAGGDHWAASGLDFGAEPNDHELDPWNCRHRWRRMLLDSTEPVDREVECHRCWKGLQVAGPLTEGIKMESGELVAENQASDSINTLAGVSHALPADENAAYDCPDCNFIICRGCKYAERTTRSPSLAPDLRD
ncbi:MAG: hypothetical protein M1830_000397 [Pleopsidium flavum]|nr:MAG: hypothetical protein M1830_000397 [Pleopsidium flavum]